jgi:predicted metalloprotease with PDZ domain
VGLRLDHRMGSAADAGFSARRNFSDPLVVNNVVADGPAEKAGLQVGDTVLSINDKPVGRDVAAMIAAMKPGDVVRVKITRRGAMHELKLTLGNREQDQYLLVDLDNITPQQRARRAVWLRTSPSRAGAATPAAPASPLGSAR